MASSATAKCNLGIGALLPLMTARPAAGGPGRNLDDDRVRARDYRFPPVLAMLAEGCAGTPGR
jgi:hypothetical protein